VIAGSARPVDAVYLKMFQKGTIVLVPTLTATRLEAVPLTPRARPGVPLVPERRIEKPKELDDRP